MVLMISISCSDEFLDVNDSSTNPPTSTPEHRIIFADEFSDEDSGWSTETSEYITRFYEDDMFHIQAEESFMGWSSNPELEYLTRFHLVLVTLLGYLQTLLVVV